MTIFVHGFKRMNEVTGGKRVNIYSLMSFSSKKQKIEAHKELQAPLLRAAFLQENKWQKHY